MIIGEVETRQIIYLSKTVEGKKHDKKLADEEAIEYPAGTLLQQDTGFQGYAPEGVIILQPKKKPRGGELTEEEKETNRILSSIRVLIEHLISGAKRLRIVKEELRLKGENISDDLMEIACSTHNFRDLMRKPYFQDFLFNQFYSV